MAAATASGGAIPRFASPETPAPGRLHQVPLTGALLGGQFLLRRVVRLGRSIAGLAPAKIHTLDFASLEHLTKRVVRRGLGDLADLSQFPDARTRPFSDRREQAPLVLPPGSPWTKRASGLSAVAWLSGSFVAGQRSSRGLEAVALLQKGIAPGKNLTDLLQAAINLRYLTLNEIAVLHASPRCGDIDGLVRLITLRRKRAPRSRWEQLSRVVVGVG